jgi:hypothetical protein
LWRLGAVQNIDMELKGIFSGEFVICVRSG